MINTHTRCDCVSQRCEVWSRTSPNQPTQQHISLLSVLSWTSTKALKLLVQPVLVPCTGLDMHYCNASQPSWSSSKLEWSRLTVMRWISAWTREMLATLIIFSDIAAGLAEELALLPNVQSRPTAARYRPRAHSASNQMSWGITCHCRWCVEILRGYHCCLAWCGFTECAWYSDKCCRGYSAHCERPIQRNDGRPEWSNLLSWILSWPRWVQFPHVFIYTVTSDTKIAELVQSPILWKRNLNQLSSGSISLRLPTSSSLAVTDQDLRDTMPTYKKIGLSLTKILVAEINSGKDLPHFVQYDSGEDVISVFKAQFEAYTQQCNPFSTCSALYTKPMLYWKALRNEPEASVLSVCVYFLFKN